MKRLVPIWNLVIYTGARDIELIYVHWPLQPGVKEQAHFASSKVSMPRRKWRPPFRTDSNLQEIGRQIYVLQALQASKVFRRDDSNQVIVGYIQVSQIT